LLLLLLLQLLSAEGLQQLPKLENNSKRRNAFDEELALHSLTNPNPNKRQRYPYINPQNKNPTFYPILIPPIQHNFPEKKLLSSSQRKQKNSLNQKTKPFHNQNIGRGTFNAPHPHKENKTKNRNKQ
jgi:hypothetical protein